MIDLSRTFAYQNMEKLLVVCTPLIIARIRLTCILGIVLLKILKQVDTMSTIRYPDNQSISLYLPNLREIISLKNL